MKPQTRQDREVILCAVESVRKLGPMAEVCYGDASGYAIKEYAATILADYASRPASADDPMADLSAWLRGQIDKAHQSRYVMGTEWAESLMVAFRRVLNHIEKGCD